MEIKMYPRTHEFEVILDNVIQFGEILVAMDARWEYQGENKVVVGNNGNLYIADVNLKGDKIYLTSFLIDENCKDESLQDFVNLYRICNKMINGDTNHATNLSK